MFVGNGVFGAEHDYGAAKIVHIGGNAELAAGLRQAAVGGDQQAGVQGFAVFQFHRGGFAVGAHAFDADAAAQANIGQRHRFFVGGAADVVVGNQIAQAVGGAAAGVFGLGKM